MENEQCGCGGHEFLGVYLEYLWAKIFYKNAKFFSSYPKTGMRPWFHCSYSK